MGDAGDKLGSSSFHRGWIGLALTVAVVAVVVLWSSQANWIGPQVGLNLQAVGLLDVATTPGSGVASQPSTQPANKAKAFCPT
jgi:hypothetical protein